MLKVKVRPEQKLNTKENKKKNLIIIIITISVIDTLDTLQCSFETSLVLISKSFPNHATSTRYKLYVHFLN